MKKQKIKGIGGWLLIPVINILIVLVFDVFLMFSYALLMTERYEAILFTTSLISFLFTLNVIYKLFNKNKNFPTFAIWWLWVTFFLSLIDGFILNDYAFTFGELIFSLIWTQYFRKSERVKNTFIK